MKNLKVYFGAFAFVLGIGSVVASQLFVPITAYQKITNSQGQVTDCIERGECEAGNFTCKWRVSASSVVNLFDNSSVTLSCGNPLTHTVNTPIND